MSFVIAENVHLRNSQLANHSLLRITCTSFRMYFPFARIAAEGRFPAAGSDSVRRRPTRVDQTTGHLRYRRRRFRGLFEGLRVLVVAFDFIDQTVSAKRSTRGSQNMPSLNVVDLVHGCMGT